MVPLDILDDWVTMTKCKMLDRILGFGTLGHFGRIEVCVTMKKCKMLDRILGFGTLGHFGRIEV